MTFTWGCLSPAAPSCTIFCVDALAEAIDRSGRAETFSADRGPQFTVLDSIGVLMQHEIWVSMDGCSSICLSQQQPELQGSISLDRENSLERPGYLWLTVMYFTVLCVDGSHYDSRYMINGPGIYLRVDAPVSSKMD